MEPSLSFNVTHCDYVLIFSPCQGRIYFKQGPVRKKCGGQSPEVADPIFSGKKLATVLVITVRVTAVSSTENWRPFLVIAVAFIHFTRPCRPLLPACKKIAAPVVGAPFCGAPVRPNMLNVPKSAVGPCVLLAYDLCPRHFLSVRQLLSYCTSSQQCSVKDKSTSPNMQSTHTHIQCNSKIHIIVAMYEQMIDIHIETIENEEIWCFRYCGTYHIFQSALLVLIVTSRPT